MNNDIDCSYSAPNAWLDKRYDYVTFAEMKDIISQHNELQLWDATKSD